LAAAAALASLAWAVSLALVDGGGGLVGSLGGRYDYLAAVADAGSPSAFLERFVADHRAWPLHVQGHPPGMVLLLLGLDAIGLARPGPVAALVLSGGASTVPAVLVAAREVAGEPAARRVAPLLVLTPAALWWSSGDALFAGMGAWAVALAVVSTGRRGWRAWTLAIFAAALGAACLLLSYGLVLLAVVPLAVAIRRRRLAPLLGAGAVVLTAAYLRLRATGFDWWAGLAATRAAYHDGVAAQRPLAYFLPANLVAFAAAVGPAAAAGVRRLARLRRPTELTLLVGAAVAAVAAADLSGLSKGEVERIWLPFAPWVAVASAALPDDDRWPIISGASAIVLALVLRSRW
jgi:hypothetical protein